MLHILNICWTYALSRVSHGHENWKQININIVIYRPEDFFFLYSFPVMKKQKIFFFNICIYLGSFVHKSIAVQNY